MSQLLPTEYASYLQELASIAAAAEGGGDTAGPAAIIRRRQRLSCRYIACIERRR